MANKANTEMGRRMILLFLATMLALIVSGGVALAVTKTCEAGVECFGTSGPDTLTGTGGADRIHGLGAADTLKGLGQDDDLFGDGGADKLFGASGLDDLVGGPGPDTSSGGTDLDTYFFGPGWGKDALNEAATATLENSLIFRGAPNGTAPVTVGLDIRLFGGEGPEVTNAAGTNTIDFQGEPFFAVAGGTGDDVIIGNRFPNVINGGGRNLSGTALDISSGADIISAGAGDDQVRVDDGDGDDTVSCGENGELGPASDSDQVFYDSGDQLAGDCEDKVFVP